MDEDIYRQHILEHYKHPQNKGVLANATHSAKGTNPMCGDALTLYFTIHNGTITESAFDGDGCAISVSATSMLTEALKGKSIEDAKLLAPGDIYNMLGVQINPGRVNCALLGYKALNDALNTTPITNERE